MKQLQAGLCVLVVCALALSCDSKGRTGADPGILLGVNSSLEWWSGGLDDSTRTLRIFEADVLSPIGGVVRMAFRWGEIEKQPGDLDFTWHDQSVDLFRSKGVAVLGVLIGTVPWKRSEPPIDISGAGFYPPDDPSDFASFASAVATHFRGRVSAWEIWNEPNTFYFWSPQPDPESYADLLALTAEALRSADPHAVLISGATASAGAVPGLSIPDVEFIDRFLTARPDLISKLDRIGFHPYIGYPPVLPPESDAPRETDSSYGARARTIRSLLQLHSAHRLGLAVTEYGFCVGDSLDEATQAAYLVRGALTLAANGVDWIFPWVLLDHGPKFRTFAPMDGLYPELSGETRKVSRNFAEGAPGAGVFDCERTFGMFEGTDPAAHPVARGKQSYRAWSDFARWFQGARFIEDLSPRTGIDGVVVFRLERGNRSIVALYSVDHETREIAFPDFAWEISPEWQVIVPDRENGELRKGSAQGTLVLGPLPVFLISEADR